MTKFQPQNARELAMVALERVEQNGAYSNLQLDQLLKKYPLADKDRRLATNIVYGVLQHKLTLKYWLNGFVNNRKLDSWVKVLLLSAIYQFHYLERVPDWAVTDESIKIAKRRGNPGIRKFVTGVLHAVLREGLPALDNIENDSQRLSVQNSVPEWLVNELMTQYGKETTAKILRSINEPAHQVIRVNRAKTTVSAVKQVLDNMNIEYHESKVAANALVITKGEVVTSDLFRDGEITIQDESAMLAVESMNIKPSDKVLDACAAPGGKTVQIAAYLSPANGGFVDALDIHQHKVRLIEKNAQRMGVSDRVNAYALDARKVDEQFKDESFDKILVDAPCSGIGLLRRKPEIRYTKQLADSMRLHQIQLSILNAVASKVKKGGIITYSTCTILQQENDATVKAFLSQHPEFKLIKTTTARKVKDGRHSATLTILPSDFDSDGFFISSLKKGL
ncbi:16S rRNA (cytosine(967)-C(5))-methyltransferase RsmB [Limosilactobacillus sp. STM2_1]|uniref:16S rRNA (cytosine(967)-C(5))-methyltransferase n=1 Tax=Limosilactobacillus rudii TaxID=2759755 RepID=A0A7W3UJE6_9LACO|nr:16S rRNA (cytosine(967)-C(5))-methyltransferase RsmB [Limosilactobacillus rudii]MBB1080168.1 16S rRNA (cytosine(967)-C(5))-methyltransferase RsmB [Limosilactobacillus rudii]MBB1096683.1 16S rRNA (cytosine(967)-C(5))-methyltransferase RsmB [Limosilactobacillus rudii]MCD7133656.1 16S rRNA (cytosine(967)-C(5))-methyltransferase RsmB [Limosilactobacillus rudii]